MRFSLTLPTDRVDRREEFLTAGAVAEMAAAIEAAGADACHVTDHPFPTQEFVDTGGHHSLDPLVTLAVAACATSRLLLHTHVFVPAYRNPFVAAKGVSTLAELSGGRVILGVAAGYLAGEFAACGTNFADRGPGLDAAIEAMRAAWTGEPVHLRGSLWEAAGNVMRPAPASPIPIWVGGNSKSALRRAARFGDAWCPFPASRRTAEALRTRPLATAADLRPLIDLLDEESEAAERPSRPAVCLTPFSHPHHRQDFDPDRLRDEAAELQALGVDWLSVRLPGEDRASFLASVARFGEEVAGRLSS